MKKLLLITLTLISINAMSQIDTVRVRTAQFKYEEFCTLRHFFGGIDSASKKFYKRFDSTIKAANPATMGTLIWLDSVPGPIAVQWFAAAKQWPDYIRDEIGDNIQTKINNYTPIQPYITTQITNALSDYFINVIRKNGKQTIEN